MDQSGAGDYEPYECQVSVILSSDPLVFISKHATGLHGREEYEKHSMEVSGMNFRRT